MAYDFAHAYSAICYGRMGVSTQRYGALCKWAIQVLNILTGNLDREGGSMFTLPAVDQVEIPLREASDGIPRGSVSYQNLIASYRHQY